MLYLSLVVLAVSILLVFGDKDGRLLGSTEEWSENCNLEVWGRPFNGRETFYVFFVPVFRRGFNHSTMLLD